MAAIERGLVNSRCGDGGDLGFLNLPHGSNENAIEKFKGKPKFGGGDVSSEPKSPPLLPPELCFSEWLLLNNFSDSDSDTASDSDREGELRRLGDQKPCLQCITNHTCEPEYKPTVKIGSYRVPDFMEAFVEKMIGSYLDNTNSVLVIDLPIFIESNSDLAELCSPYGNVTSADLAVELESGYAFPGCFGFVSFATRDDAQNAINNLKGVQWLTPTTIS